MTKQHKHYEAAFKLEVARMVMDKGIKYRPSGQRYEHWSHRRVLLD